MKKDKYLPIGTVVLLKGGKKRVMIVGFFATCKEIKDKVFDYIGCLYPEGIFDSNKNLLFNQEQIDKIYSLGYVDEEWIKLEDKFKKISKDIEKNN